MTARRKEKKTKKISTLIRQNLLKVLVVAVIISHIGIIFVQIRNENRYAFGLIEEFVDDVTRAVHDIIDNWINTDIVSYAEFLGSHMDDMSDDFLQENVKVNSDIVSEINIVDSNGIITYSSNPEYVGFDMNSGEQSKEFMCLLNGRDCYVQDMRGNSFDDNRRMMYVGKALPDGEGFVQIGISDDVLEKNVVELLAEVVRNRRIGMIGYLLIVDSDMNIIGSTNDKYTSEKFENPELLPESEDENKRSKAHILGNYSYIVAALTGNYYIVGGFPVEEAGLVVILDRVLVMAMNMLIFGCIFIVLTIILNKRVVHEIETINGSLAKITEGDLDEKADVRSSREFEELSDGINDTVGKLKQLIAEADARIDEELETARNIQQSSLPKAGDAFTKRKDFGLFAGMDTAKLVGGDFYDFYFLPGGILVVTIADVSDKGIPAAMFMMRAKALLKSLAEEGLPVADMVTAANKGLWENNEGDMFVTAWIGFLELRTGKLKYVHAGHTCPVIFNRDGAKLIRQKREMLIGGMPDVTYHEQEVKLNPGDTIFLYTDGVTEAINKEREEFGYDRLLSVLSDTGDKDESMNSSEYCEKVCTRVLDEVMAFSEGEQQADDITMLCVRYDGKKGGQSGHQS